MTPHDHAKSLAACTLLCCCRNLDTGYYKTEPACLKQALNKLVSQMSTNMRHRFLCLVCAGMAAKLSSLAVCTLYTLLSASPLCQLRYSCRGNEPRCMHRCAVYLAMLDCLGEALYRPEVSGCHRIRINFVMVGPDHIYESTIF